MNIPNPYSVKTALAQRADATLPAPVADADQAGRESACRVLVVDDNQDGADLLAVLLRMQGYWVKVAHDGLAALKIASTFDADFVLLDIGLPGLNGCDVARQLRRMNRQHPQCLIAVTGYGTDEDLQRTQEAGFDHHIVKPIEPAELNALMARSITAMSVSRGARERA